MNSHSITQLMQRAIIAVARYHNPLRTRPARLAAVSLLAIVSLLGLATPSFARSSTAYDLFKIQYPFTPQQAGYNCMREDWGAVVNNCGITVYLTFDLVIDNVYPHGINVWNYWNGSGNVGVSCTPWTYNGHGSGVASNTQTFNAYGQENLNWNTSFVNSGEAITLFCSVPPTQGIALINWSV